MEQVSGWAEQGGSVVVIPGTQGSGVQRFQQSFRSATVTVRDSSNNLATIYSDDLASPTAKANPFTASSTSGAWNFFTTTGTYTLTFSGGSILAPFSITVNVGLGNAGGVPSYAFASLPTSKTQNAGDIARVTDVTRGLWMDSGTQWFGLSGQVCNVKEFGATGNGTTDDSAAIQAAINAAVAIRGAVYFPATAPSGYSLSYNIGTTSLTATNGVTILAPRGGAVIKYSGTGYALDFGVSGSTTTWYDIQNLRFFLMVNGANGIKLTRVHQWTLRNIYVEGNVSGSQTNIALCVESLTGDCLFGLVDTMVCNHVKTGFKPQSTGSVNGVTTIQFNNFSAFCDDLSGSKGVDYGTSGCGDGFVFNQCNFEHCDYGIYSDGGAGFDAHLAKHFGCRFESNVTADVYLGAFVRNFGFFGSIGLETIVDSSRSSTFIDYANYAGDPQANKTVAGLDSYIYSTSDVPIKSTIPVLGTQNLIHFLQASAPQDIFIVNRNGHISTLSGAAILIRAGAGSPEASVTAIVGSLYLQTNGTTSSTLWIKSSGSGNTGWDRMAGFDANRNQYVPYTAGGTSSILLNTEGAGTGALFLQAGLKSSAYGGSVTMYSAVHATKPKDVAIGSAGGKFRVNSDGLDAGSNRFIVDTSNGNTTISVDLNVGAPTGGFKGAGTANFAGDIYKNDTAYTNPDYAFEHYFTGRIVKFKDNDGADKYRGVKSLSKVRQFARKFHRLPGFHRTKGVFARFDLLLEKIEEIYIYLWEMNDRITALEKRN